MRDHLLSLSPVRFASALRSRNRLRKDFERRTFGGDSTAPHAADADDIDGEVWVPETVGLTDLETVNGDSRGRNSIRRENESCKMKEAV